MTLPANLAAKIQVTDTCWLWTGAVQSSGYGSASIGNGRTGLAHRVVYELLVGPITLPQLDHLCRVRLCVNPEHLEPVTQSVNLQRGFAARGPKSECVIGHDTTDPDSRDSTGYCRKCKQANARVTAMRVRPSRVAIRLRELMAANGISQTELGAALGLSQISVSRRLTGHTPLTHDELRRAQHFLTSLHQSKAA